MAQSNLLGQAFINTRAAQQAVDLQEMAQQAVQNPEELIRFHVLANSDSEEDQALKRAVRDAILEEVSPRLAASRSIEESREILMELRPEMEAISKKVIESWGKDYAVKTDYGNFIFPTKSYGSLILPAGEYEAVRILIGEARGSNWWCVLFPALCFVDIEHSTAVAVDGKPGIPYEEKNSVDKPVEKPGKKPVEKSVEKPVVRFWFVELLMEIF
jgi:stage II sporulation protein R